MSVQIPFHKTQTLQLNAPQLVIPLVAALDVTRSCVLWNEVRVFASNRVRGAAIGAHLVLVRL